MTQFPNKSLHERKEVPDIIGTNGTGRKSKQWEGSMATISVVKHLTMVSNYGNLILRLDMLLTKWPWCSDWQDRLLASPRFHTKNKHHPQSDGTKIPYKEHAPSNVNSLLLCYWKTSWMWFVLPWIYPKIFFKKTYAFMTWIKFYIYTYLQPTYPLTTYLPTTYMCLPNLININAQNGNTIYLLSTYFPTLPLHLSIYEVPI